MKWYFKFENIRDKFEVDSTVGDVHKDLGDHGHYTTLAISTVVLQFTCTPQKFVQQCSHETGVSLWNVQNQKQNLGNLNFVSGSVQRILKSAKWKVYIPRLLHAMKDSDRKLQYCEWFWKHGAWGWTFSGKVVWSDAQFKVNGTLNCVYLVSENPHGEICHPVV